MENIFIKILYRIFGQKRGDEFIYSFSFIGKNKFKSYQNKKKIILTLLPQHGNLGDHAIAKASKIYLEDFFPDYEIIELDLFEIYKYGKMIKCILNKDDFIVTIGGGNMNNIYIHEENTRRFLINKFHEVPIVSFPQTIAFEDTLYGQQELDKTKSIYNSHPNLTIYAREQKSYEIMNNNFEKCNVLMNPDMVFYLENIKLNKSYERQGILICLRNDLEGYLDKEKRDDIVSNLQNHFKKVKIADTVINKKVNIYTRDKELENIWGEFSSSKIVITDRLHGMIFAFITRTPAIIIRNSDHKILESYKWIKDLNYIRLIDDFSFDTIKSNIEDLMNIKYEEVESFRNKYFRIMYEDIQKNILGES